MTYQLFFVFCIYIKKLTQADHLNELKNLDFISSLYCEFITITNYTQIFFLIV